MIIVLVPYGKYLAFNIFWYFIDNFQLVFGLLQPAGML